MRARRLAKDRVGLLVGAARATLKVAVVLGLILGGLTYSNCEGATESAWTQATRYHLLLGDYPAACDSVTQALQEHPSSVALLQLAIESYAMAGQSRRALTYWHQLQLPTQAKEVLLEQVAWGVLEEGIGSAAPLARLLALVGGASAGGKQSTAFVGRSLSDPCALVRLVACQLAGKLKARTLVPTLLRLMAKDRAWQVREAALTAIGELRIANSEAALLQAVARLMATTEERQAAAAALVALDEEAAPQWVEWLSKHPETSMRLLACEVAAYSGCMASSICLLLDDPCAQVQAAALQTLGILYPTWSLDETTLTALMHCSAAHDYCVAASAGWLLTLCKQPAGLVLLQQLLAHPLTSVRSCAAAALTAAGKEALPSLQIALKAAMLNFKQDRATAATLAIGLLGQRSDMAAASHCLMETLADRTLRWRWQRWGIFRALAPAASEDDLASNTLEDAAVRLELLNLLAITQPTLAMPSLQLFLQERTWGVSGAAAALLLSEGDDSALELIQQLLLAAPTAHQRLQAALVLALWGRSDTAAAPLQAAYPLANREAKERILAALGHIGAPLAQPLLIGVLAHPSPSLRIQAAAALLQALSH